MVQHGSTRVHPWSHLSLAGSEDRASVTSSMKEARNDMIACLKPMVGCLSVQMQETVKMSDR